MKSKLAFVLLAVIGFSIATVTFAQETNSDDPRPASDMMDETTNTEMNDEAVNSEVSGEGETEPGTEGALGNY